MPKKPTQIERVGAEIRRRRIEAGLTQEKLGELSDLTPNFIGTIERGARDPSLSTLKAVAHGLRVTVGDLLGGATPISVRGVEMAERFDQAPEAVQSGLLRFLRAVKRGG